MGNEEPENRRVEGHLQPSQPLDVSLSAEECNAQANAYFQKKSYEVAIAYYTRAIELDRSAGTYYGNRAFSYLKTECYGFALADANKAIELAPNYVKAYYRRAMAYMFLGNYHDSIKDLRHVCKVAPNDVAAKRHLQECEKIVKRLEFERAIAVDDDEIESKKRTLDTIDIDGIDVDPSYDGPLLEEGVREVTVSFLKTMTEAFKSQKPLHRKCVYQVNH
jgi:serine/threonine-protein phosphatase 5